MKLNNRVILILSIFCPLLVILAAYFIFPVKFEAAVFNGNPVGWIWIFLFALFALFVIYMATYIQRQTEMSGVFKKLDTNDDGYISVEEAHGYKDLNKVFKKFDKNRAGYLTRREFARAVRETANAH